MLLLCILGKVDRVQSSPNSTINSKEAIPFWSITKGIKAVHPNVLLMTNLIQGGISIRLLVLFHLKEETRNEILIMSQDLEWKKIRGGIH